MTHAGRAMNEIDVEEFRLKVHRLKCWPESFEAVRAGRKTAELRRDDRNYRVSEYLVLQEYDPESDTYSGREVRAVITHVLPGGRFGLAEGHVMLSLRLVRPADHELMEKMSI